MSILHAQSAKLRAKIKQSDPDIQKYLTKLQGNVEKLHSDTVGLDIDNSNLRIDNRRLRSVIKSLEAKYSQYEPPSEQEKKDVQRAAEEAIKALQDTPTEKLTEQLTARLKESSRQATKT